jgi:F-type H+-transporting ATPase subunit delta
MVDVYTALSRHEMGIEEADVTSAYPLSEEQADDLKKKLQEITGYKIIMKQKVDPELIGGFTVMIGDRMIDGSVARQLRELKSKIMQRD